MSASEKGRGRAAAAALSFTNASTSFDKAYNFRSCRSMRVVPSVSSMLAAIIFERRSEISVNCLLPSRGAVSDARCTSRARRAVSTIKRYQSITLARENVVNWAMRSSTELPDEDVTPGLLFHAAYAFTTGFVNVVTVSTLTDCLAARKVRTDSVRVAHACFIT